ncbi:MAG TPA: acyl carrier protein [Chthoniobacterales bacterium]|jgi:3-hydroxyacyl-[acyl-carrier-protein] dehydratase|nr:acyl carrier protein [Chthoniobacterales bacterium]
MNDPQIDDRFFGFPPELVVIIQEYGETHNAALVPGIVHGIIDRYVPPGSRASAESLSALGLESLTLMEVILDIQDALGLTLSDDELRALANLDEATAILEKKVAQLSAPNESQ